MCVKSFLKEGQWVKPTALFIISAFVWVATTSWAVSQKNSDLSTIKESSAALQEAQKEDHESIIRLQVNQENMKDSLSEIKQLIKDAAKNAANHH